MGRMASLEYVVIQDKGKWAIGFCGEYFGQYESLKDAVDTALIDAGHAGRLGHDIQVVVQRSTGKVREVWAYDQNLHRMTRRN